MQKSRSMILGLALALALPAAVRAQSQERSTNSGDTKSVTCRVTNVNAGEKSFTADCPEGSMTFTTTSSTQFMKSTSGASGATGSSGANASMSDLKTGDQVRVTYSQAAGTSGSTSGSTGGTTGGAGAGMRHAATKVEILPASGTTGSSGSSGSTGASSSASGYGDSSGAQQPSSSSGSQYGGSQSGGTSPYGSAGSTSTASSTTQSGNKVTGRVATVDRQNRTLVIETAQGRQTFKVDQSNTSVDFNSIREGEQVEITFSGTGTDRRISSLRMMPDQIGQQGGSQAGSQSAQTGSQYGGSTSGTGTEARASQRSATSSSTPSAQGQQKATGKVVEIDQKKLVIQTSRGRETFMIDETAPAVDLASFHEGDQVVVMYTGSGNTKKVSSVQASNTSHANQPGRNSGDAAHAGQRLPQTASELPFIGLVGLFLLAAAFGLRYVRRHV